MNKHHLPWKLFPALAGVVTAMACGPMPEDVDPSLESVEQAAICEDCEPGGGGGGGGGGTTTSCGDGVCNQKETHCGCPSDCVDDESAMVNAFAPIFRFDAREDNLPSSVEWYLARTTLRFNHDGGCSDESVLSPYTVNTTNLLQQSRATRSGWPWCGNESTYKYSNSYNGSDEFFFLQIPNDGNELSTRNGDTSGWSWRTYAHVRRDGGTGWEIQYWLFFPYNGMTPGEHEGDFEHVTVRVAADKVTPISVYYAAHDSEGSTVPWSSVEREGNHPYAYVAHDSHASYPHSGWTDRTWPLPNDEHWGDGRVYNSTNTVIHVGDSACNFNGHTWLRFGGRWGEVGENFSGPFSPTYQSYWTTLGQ